MVFVLPVLLYYFLWLMVRVVAFFMLCIGSSLEVTKIAQGGWCYKCGEVHNRLGEVMHYAKKAGHLDIS
jgi:hypothetical protein